VARHLVRFTSIPVSAVRMHGAERNLAPEWVAEFPACACKQRL